MLRTKFHTHMKSEYRHIRKLNYRKDVVQSEDDTEEGGSLCVLNVADVLTLYRDTGR